MDDLVRQSVAELGGAAPRHRAERRRRVPHETLGERLAVGTDDLDRIVDVERTVDLAHARGQAAIGCRRTRHARAPSSTTIFPAAPRANAIHSLRLGRRSGFGRTAVPTARPSIASTITSGTSAPAITARTPDHAAIFAAASLLAIPPLPRAVPVPPATASRAASTSAISSIRDAPLVETRVGGEEPGRVGEQDEHVGVHEVRHERREAVVVAVANLVVGHGVVLVDYGNHAEIEEAPQRVTRMEVLRSHAEVVRGEQHLAREQPVLPEDRADPCHEQRLPDRGDRLEQTRCRWDGSPRPSAGRPGRDRAGAHEHDLVAPSRARSQLRCTA